MKERRLSWIDLLKGMAIVLVVLQHACGGLLKAGLFKDEILIIVIDEIGLFHMPLFMTVSGYLFYEVYAKDGILKLKKCIIHIADLMTIYILFSISRYAVKMFFPYEVNKSLSAESILFIWKDAIDELWFLYALIVIYIVMSLLPAKAVVVYYILFICSSIYFVLNPEINTTLNEAFKYLGFFLLGTFYHKNDNAFLNRKGWGWLVLETLLLVIFHFLFYRFSGTARLERMFILAIAYFCCDIILCGGYLFEKKQETLQGNIDISKMFRYIGKNTLVIYLIHVYCTASVRGIIKKIEISNMFVAVFLLTVLGIVVPIMIKQLLTVCHMDRLFFSPVSFLLNNGDKEKNEKER